MGAYRKRRVIRRKRPIRRRYGRRRATAKPRRAYVSRKRLLDITSVKKHDNMRPMVRNPDSTITPGPITVGTGFASLYMPSARAFSTIDYAESHRTKQSTYSVGYKETLAINCTSGGIWKWRRVVFSTKDPAFYNQTGDALPWIDQSTGDVGNMARSITLLPTSQYVRVRDLLYDGQEGVDWNDQFTAKVDTTRVTLHSDRIVTINPGNETGKALSRKFFYRTGKNLVYDDDEAGASKAVSYTSVGSKLGMGNLMVYDVVLLVVPPNLGVAPASMLFAPEGTYYWHER
ncbi:MAG: capsid protein [Gemycircularvirus mouti10]|uniref:capsid protein n=1 Tax=Genomoviridae sp. TaxID=2202565 RepID=UPI0024819F03|nr:MAG: capsid protein [Genomoviridae sp.]QCW23626.1 MAG: capsid protein [Genomoviridae sp.]